jgi:hypothetical protein
MSTRGLQVFALIAAACLVPASGQEPKAQEQNDKTLTLSVADMKRQMISCKPHKISRGLLPKGTVVPILVSIDERGKVIGLSPVGRCPVGCGLLAEPIVSIREECKFAPLTVNGRAVSYKGNVELVAP